MKTDATAPRTSELYTNLVDSARTADIEKAKPVQRAEAIDQATRLPKNETRATDKTGLPNVADDPKRVEAEVTAAIGDGLGAKTARRLLLVKINSPGEAQVARRIMREHHMPLEMIVARSGSEDHATRRLLLEIYLPHTSPVEEVAAAARAMKDIA